MKESSEPEIVIRRVVKSNNIFSFLIPLFGLGIIILENKITSVALELIGISLLGFGIGNLIYRYLQTGLTKQTSDTKFNNSALESEIENLKVELFKLKKKTGQSSLNEDSVNEAIDKIINNTLTENFIIEKIEDHYKEEALIESKMKEIYDDFDSLDYRIDGELSRLRRSANLNLVIGTLATGFAIIALIYEVFRNEIDFSETVAFLSHYLPRLSVVIFIEIFAFFFLKLYKVNLCDIKYFSNEKTNIELKIIALKTALAKDDKKLIEQTIEEFSKTERNFILNKGESTIEIEKSKIENNKLLSELINKVLNKV